MNEKESVELSTYGAGRTSLHESLKYLRKDEKTLPRMKRIAAAVGAVAILLILLKKDPETAPASSRANQEVPPPTMDGSAETINLDAYNRGAEVRRAASMPRSQGGPAVRFSGPKLIARTNKLKVPPGTEASGILVTGASNGLVKVKLKGDVTVAGENFLSSGTMLVGNGSSTEDRLFVHFTRAVLSDGSVATIEGEIADASDKTVGLKGSFLSRHAARIAAGAGLNFLAGASVALQDTEGQQGAVVTKPTMRNAVLSGTAKAAIEESNEIASKYKNSPPAIEIKPGTEVFVIFTESGG